MYEIRFIPRKTLLIHNYIYLSLLQHLSFLKIKNKNRETKRNWINNLKKKTIGDQYKITTIIINNKGLI